MIDSSLKAPAIYLRACLKFAIGKCLEVNTYTFYNNVYNIIILGLYLVDSEFGGLGWNTDCWVVFDLAKYVWLKLMHACHVLVCVK